MERIHELNQLKGFRVALTSFLTRFGESQKDRIELLEGIDRLDQIVAEASQGEVDSSKVDQWMKKYMPLAKKSSLADHDRARISALLLEMQRGANSAVSDERMNSEVDSLARLRQKVADWRTRSVMDEAELAAESNTSSGAIDTTERTDGEVSVPLTSPRPVVARDSAPAQTKTQGSRKFILKRKSEGTEPDLGQRFIEALWSELDYMEQDARRGQHALTRLNDILNCAETKTDPMFTHLAGSFIYFLRREGYKMSPYVKRLRRIEAQLAELPQSARETKVEEV
ncbi:MAG: hypothetical protein ACE5GA_00670 [Candidatus Zixiibacteriota bacterium]